MRRLRNRKLNNNGSTLVFVVVAIIFIGLLASLILALSASSFKMRTVDYTSRQNFFEGEEYSGKIYANLGMNAIGILGEAYVNTMGKINTDTIYGQQALNNYLKKLYYKNMVVYLGLAANTVSDSDITLIEKAYDSTEVVALSEKLQNIADSSKKLVSVKICGDVVCKIEGGTRTTAMGEEKYPTIVINDVRLQYLDTTTTGNGFESDYTFDIILQYPEWDFTFVNPASAASDVDTFLDYVLISNGKIEFVENTARNVVGCIATGMNTYATDNSSTDNGLWIKGAAVSFEPNNNNRYNKLAIVVSDNVRIDSTQNSTSSMTIKKDDTHGNVGDLWCNSVILGDAGATVLYTKESVFKSNSANLYIRDDLQLDADYSKAEIAGGSYFGYGNNNLIEGAGVQNASSAIIVNGKYASLKMSALSQINVLGLAYINLGGTIYRTGESITVKGNQDLYLIPDSLMGTNVSNPIKAGSASEGRFDGNVLKSNILANTWLRNYVDSDTPYIAKTAIVNGVSYTFYYFRFSSVYTQNRFAADVMSTGGTANAVRTEIRERVLDNLAVMNDRVLNGVGVTEEDKTIISASGTFFTVGADVTSAITGDQDRAKGTENVSAGDMASITLDSYTLQRKYTLMKCLLMPVKNTILSNYSDVDRIDLEWKKDKYGSAKYPYTGHEAILNENLNRPAVNNFIDIARLNNYVNAAKAKGNLYYSCKHSGKEIRYYNNDVTVDGTFSSVSVVVVDGNVNVTAAFKGLIMATGQITVSGSGTLESDPETVDALMKLEQNQGSGHTNCLDDQIARSDVFYFYPVIGSTSIYGDSINQLRYSDVLYYDNWRRYGVSEPAAAPGP